MLGYQQKTYLQAMSSITEKYKFNYTKLKKTIILKIKIPFCKFLGLHHQGISHMLGYQQKNIIHLK
jgi:hypothetical protein